MDTIGNMLYTARRKKGLEIIDAEQATGIRGVYLKALEEGKYDILPGEVYVKGFIRNYANYLELDGAHLVQLYNHSTTPAAILPQVMAEAPPTAKTSSVTRSSSVNKKTISTIVVVILLAVSAWSLYAWQKDQPTSKPVAIQEAVSKTPATATTKTPLTTSSVGTVYPTPPAGAKPVVLAARFNDRCWTSIIADGKTLYEGIPKNGEMFTWEAERQIVVNFGNAAAVDLTFNGQPVGKIGERGDVVVKTFTAQGMVATPTTHPVPATSSAPSTPSVPNNAGVNR